MKTQLCGMLAVGFVLLTVGSVAVAATVTVTVEQPEHGTLMFTPALPADGQVEAGSRFTVYAEPSAGYALDTVFEAMPGRFGRSYIESRNPEYELVVNQDKVVSALFLPEAELQGWNEVQNVEYAQPGVKPLKYDVFAPPAANALPIVVIIHGGGWATNSEDIMRGMAREIVRSGRYVAISIDYRWVGTGDGDAKGNSMDALINDVFGALAHIQQHAAAYGGDPARIAVTGDSAGGHLSAVAATMVGKIGSGGFGSKPGVFEFMPSYLPAGNTAEQVRESLTSAIQVAAPSYGIFAAAGEGRIGLQHYGDPAVADATWATAIAPINHIPDASARAVPHYLIRGTADPLISLAMVKDYADALNAQAQLVKHVEVEGASHAFFDWKPDAQTRATFAQYGVPYIHDMLTFFDGVFYPAR
ncbi:MAG: alpha/beta hydrolase [Pseudomonadota bacterium]